jgi:8-oxo-dGTP pyrophosphatase MutT (NUDIX family)
MQSRGPWRVRSVATRYDDPWIRLEHHEVITPGGRDGIYGVVHFKNYAIGIIPLDDEQNTWLVGQHRYPHDAYSWEIPEGGGPLDVPPLESAQRELREEVGLAASHWDLILELDLSNSVTDERSLIYVARGLTVAGDPHPDHTEELVLRKQPFSALYEDVLAGQHKDSLTVAGVLKLQQLMQRGLLRKI